MDLKDAIELVKKSHPYAMEYKGIKEDEALQVLVALAEEYLKERPRVSGEDIERILETVLMKHCDALGEQDDYAVGMATDALMELINGKEA